MIAVKIWKNYESFFEGEEPWWASVGVDRCAIIDDLLYIESDEGINLTLPKGQLVIEEIRQKAEETNKALNLDTPLKQPGYSVLMTKHGEGDVKLLLESLAQKPTSKATVLANSGNDPVVVVLSEQDLRGDTLYRLQEFANIYLSTEEPK